MMGELMRLAEERDQLLDQIAVMRAALLKAADHFTAYAVHHAAKVPPDWDRSSVNEALAKQCRDAAK